MATAPIELFTDEEIAKVILAFARGCGRPFTEDECKPVVEWARLARIEASLLEGVLQERLQIDVREDGELTFQAVPPKG